MRPGDRGIGAFLWLAPSFGLAGCAAVHASDVDAAGALGLDAARVDAPPAPVDAAAATAADGGECAWGGGCALHGHDCPPGQGCVPGSVATVCAPAGTAAPGAPCAATSDCEAGAICVTHTGGARTCARVACDPRACQDPVPSTSAFYPIAAPIPVGVCDDFWCTPFPDSCPEGFACRIGIDSWVTCTVIGTVANGGACATPADCQAGLTCSGPVCTRMCRTDADCAGHCDLGGPVGVCAS